MQIQRTRVQITFVLITSICLALMAGLSYTHQASAQTEPTVTMTGASGTIQTYTLTQIQTMPSVSMYGGFYQTNQQISNRGLWTGVSILYLCNQVGGISSNSNITVTGQGSNSFTYDMVNSGIHFNDAYKTYSNITGAEINQTQSATLILAYQVNGTALPSSSQPAPRLVIVGSEGLLMDGSGGRSITQITITNISPSPTPTPTPSPTPTSMPSPTPSPTPKPTTSPPPSTPSPTPTVQPTASPTPTNSPSPTPADTGLGEWPVTYIVIIAAVIIIIIISAVSLVLRRR